jgi:hypothetical protein
LEGKQLRNWLLTIAIARPPSRSIRDSPTQTITARPALCATSAFARTTASLSPWPTRRSEWPTIT